MRYPRALAAAFFTMALVLAGCSNNDEAASTGKGFNDADAAFATDMIQHHAQALEMVDLTMGRTLDPAVQTLAEDVREAQAPEIEEMTVWLQKWGEPIPATSRDHANAHGDGMEMDSDMPGMMSGQEMQTLEDATDAQFQRLWLEMMIEHHEGAIEMAETEQDDGENRKAVDLAGDIAASQQKELSTLRDLLAI